MVTTDDIVDLLNEINDSYVKRDEVGLSRLDSGYSEYVEEIKILLDFDPKIDYIARLNFVLDRQGDWIRYIAKSPVDDDMNIIIETQYSSWEDTNFQTSNFRKVDIVDKYYDETSW